MRTILRPLLCGTAFATLAACASASGSDPGRQAAAQGQTGPFAQALAREYNAFADSEMAQSDWADQGTFRRKARMAAQGDIPAPEDPRNRGVGTGLQLHPEVDIGKQQRAEAIQGRQRLTDALSGGATQRNPDAAARAQVAYDCWVEQLEEGWQRDDIERCRGAFNTALAQLEARPVAAAPRPAPQVSELNQVYFEFDSASLTPEGQRSVAQAASQILAARPDQVVVQGHTDTAGTEGYNQELAAERAQAVARELAAQGVPPGRIETQALGESQLAVATPDGVPQPQNRRAVIEFD